jgi:hypothetical protein
MTTTTNPTTETVDPTTALLEDQIDCLVAELKDVLQSLTGGGDFDFCEWLDGFLDWEFLKNRRGEIVSHVLTVTIGGPSIHLETNGEHVEIFGRWGSDRRHTEVEAPEIIERLDELAEVSRLGRWV